jgi:hypothetical protein
MHGIMLSTNSAALPTTGDTSSSAHSATCGHRVLQAYRRSGDAWRIDVGAPGFRRGYELQRTCADLPAGRGCDIDRIDRIGSIWKCFSVNCIAGIPL